MFTKVHMTMREIVHIDHPNVPSHADKLIRAQAVASIVRLDNLRISYKNLRQDLIEGRIREYSEIGASPINLVLSKSTPTNNLLTPVGLYAVNEFLQRGRNNVQGISMNKEQALHQLFNTKVLHFSNIMEGKTGADKDPLDWLTAICVDLLVLDAFKVYNRRTVLTYINSILVQVMGYPPITNTLEDVEVDRFKFALDVYRNLGDYTVFKELFASWLYKSAKAKLTLRTKEIESVMV